MNRRTRSRLVGTASGVLTSGALVALTACASAALDTGEMTASIVVVAGDADSRVSVVLSAPGQAALTLPEGDRVQAWARTEGGSAAPTTLSGTTYAGASGYAGALDGVTEPSTEVVVALRRDGAAPLESSVTLPGPIFLVAPSAGATVPRSSALELGVNAGAGSTRVEWAGPCVADGRLDLVSGAPVVLPAGAVTPRSDDDAAATCPLELTVSRVFAGDLDPAYGGGSITAQRSVAVAVTSVP